MTPSEHPKVFISYSHDSPEHDNRVLDLANRLRFEGIDAEVDQYESAPPEGWPQIDRAEMKECLLALEQIKMLMSELELLHLLSE